MKNNTAADCDCGYPVTLGNSLRSVQKVDDGEVQFFFPVFWFFLFLSSAKYHNFTCCDILNILQRNFFFRYFGGGGGVIGDRLRCY